MNKLVMLNFVVVILNHVFIYLPVKMWQYLSL